MTGAGPGGFDGALDGDDGPVYIEEDDGRRSHRRLGVLGILTLAIAIVALFLPRAGLLDGGDGFGGGSDLSPEELQALVQEFCTGAAGADGAPGAAGDDGTDGAPGAPGAEGAPGDDGAPGAPGADGAPGAPGPEGPVGPEGPPGLCGPIGATGPPGPEGPAGPAGTDGADGAIGPTGATGPAGPVGLTGPQGDPGPRGDRGPKGDQGDPGLPGTGGLGSFGAFWDQCIQVAYEVDTPYAMRFSHSESFNDGVSVADADGDECEGGEDARGDEDPLVGSPGGSAITFEQPGIYNIQFSAQYWRLQGGSEGHISIWIRRNGSDVAWTNTDFPTVANSTKQVAMVNWFVPVECDPTCDSYELWWAADVDAVELLAIPLDGRIGPEVPSIILTVNQVGGPTPP